ncbi:MAG: hypothetical protein R3C97_00560 [Geminicoccaceae bacterium]
MSIESDTNLTEIRPGTVAEKDYQAWLDRQLAQAVSDLDHPDRHDIDHETLFGELDRIIADHEGA